MCELLLTFHSFVARSFRSDLQKFFLFPTTLQVNGKRNSRVMKVNADAW